MATETDFSAMAAQLGRRGGLVSKRPPGPLRGILAEVCEEVGSMINRDIFRYWQKYDIEACAENSPDHTCCWFRHRLYAKTQTSNDPGLAYQESTPFVYRALPEVWDDIPDGDYVYHYFDGKQNAKTNARAIRRTLHRIRADAANRLSGTGTANTGW